MSDRADLLDQQKKDAALRAVQLVKSGMIVGLGTGSTANHATEAIGRELKSGRLENLLSSSEYLSRRSMSSRS